MTIRSKTLDDEAIYRLVKNFTDSVLELRYDAAEEMLCSSDYYESMKEIFEYTHQSITAAVRARSEVNGLHIIGFAAVPAEYLCRSEGYDVDLQAPEYRKLVHQLSMAKQSILETLQERLETGTSDYDKVLTASRMKQLTVKPRSNTLSELVDAYVRAKGKITGKSRQSKVAEKMDKIVECFKAESGQDNLLLSDITYALTERVGHSLAKYPCYRSSRYMDKTLHEINQLNGVQYPSETTVREEIFCLSGLFEFGITKLDGLNKNYAKNLADVVLGRSTSSPSAARDIFRDGDVREIITGLERLKAKGYFINNPHLLFITLIGLFSGARINEISQLQVTDLAMVDGLWCFIHAEDGGEKSLKNTNSARINPIHPALLDFGLIRFRDSQTAKGYAGLWEGVKNHKCDFYEQSGNCSHYVSKWWNGTFKSKLALSNPGNQTFHSTRHTFINWFKQNIRPLDYEARNALSGHLDKDDIATLRLQGFDPESEGETTYSKGLNVHRQLVLLSKLDYGVDLAPLMLN